MSRLYELLIMLHKFLAALALFCRNIKWRFHDWRNAPSPTEDPATYMLRKQQEKLKRCT